MIRSITLKLSKFVTEGFNYNKKECAMISYGLEAIIGLIIKLIIYLTVSYLFGVLEESVVVMLNIAILRYSAGGFHCKPYLKCLIASGIIYIVIGIISNYFILNEYIFLISSLIFIIIVLIKAPVDPPEKPIKTKIYRYKMKIISTLTLLFQLYLIGTTYIPSNLKNSIFLGVTFQIFSLTNCIKFFTNWLKIKKKGGDTK
jgi:accessory gene regulator B